MKKILLSLLAVFCVAGTIVVPAYAAQTDVINSVTAPSNVPGQLVEIKQKEEKELEDYKNIYGPSYGFAAYILNKVRIYSIPCCFIGIAIGAIYQYMIGVRRLDIRDRGLILVVMFVTVLVICQVLPLVFAIVVKGWRG